jgi:hypothetical protein
MNSYKFRVATFHYNLIMIMVIITINSFDTYFYHYASRLPGDVWCRAFPQLHCLIILCPLTELLHVLLDHHPRRRACKDLIHHTIQE